MSRKEYGEAIEETGMTAIQKALAKRKAIAESRKGETDEQRSVRIANRRTNKVLKGLEELSRLAGSNYSLSAEHKNKIITKLNERMIIVVNAFNKVKAEQEEFKL